MVTVVVVFEGVVLVIVVEVVSVIGSVLVLREGDMNCTTCGGGVNGV